MYFLITLNIYLYILIFTYTYLFLLTGNTSFFHSGVHTLQGLISSTPKVFKGGSNKGESRSGKSGTSKTGRMFENSNISAR